jgi:hypothetical protein
MFWQKPPPPPPPPQRGVAHVAAVVAIVVGGVTVAATILGGLGTGIYWFATRNTTSDDKIAVFERNLADESAARKQVGTDLTTMQKETNAKLETLNTHAAVQDNESKTQSETLKQILSKLDHLTVTTVPALGKVGR